MSGIDSQFLGQFPVEFNRHHFLSSFGQKPGERTPAGAHFEYCPAPGIHCIYDPLRYHPVVQEVLPQ